MRPFSGMLKTLVPGVEVINVPGLVMMKTDKIGWVRVLKGAISIRWTGEAWFFETKYFKTLTRRTPEGTFEVAVTLGAKRPC